MANILLLCITLIDLTACMQNSVFCWVKSPRLYITYSWFASLVLVLIAFIIACISANKSSKTGTNNFSRAAGFGAMWTVLLLILLSVVGSVIMRKVFIFSIIVSLLTIGLKYIRIFQIVSNC